MKMKTNILRWLLSGALALSAAACGGRSVPAEGFDRTLYAPRYAAGFEIAGTEGAASTLLRIRNPWQGAEGIESQLFIARDGEEAPAGFDGQVLHGDARRIVCMSSTHVAMLGALGADSTIVGVSGIGFLSNPYVTANRDRIGDVGYDGNIDYERLLSLAPDLVLLYGVNSASGMEPKLRELGIPYVYLGDYVEELPLGKAEWMVAVGETIGRRAEAEARFAELPVCYEYWRKRAAESTRPSPKVMLNSPYGDAWFMPSTRSCIARLIADAGGDYIYRKNTGSASQPVDLEEAALLASEADAWIHVGGFATLAELQQRLSKFADVPCVRAGNVWECDRRKNAAGGNDFWESGIVHPDLILRDLVRIFRPEAVDDPAEAPFVYYRKLE